MTRPSARAGRWSAQGSRPTLRRAVAALLYSVVGRHLPWSPRPFGLFARRFRAALAVHMLDACGDQVNIEHGAIFGSGKGIRLGDRSDIGMDCLVMGPVSIGADVMMGPRCILIASSHATADVAVSMNLQGFLPDEPIVIEDDVWVGAATVILPGCVVGRGSIVGAGSIVTKNVAPFSVVAGNPARTVRSRLTPEDAEQKDRAASESGDIL